MIRPRLSWPTIVSVLRLAAAVVLLAAGLLVVLPAQTYRLWLLSLGLTEFGHWIAPIALVLLWPGWEDNWPGRLAALLGVAAAACLLTPLVRAFPVAHQLPQRLEAAFGPRTQQPLAQEDAPSRARPLDALQLFGAVPVPPLEAETIAYAERDGRPETLSLYLREGATGGPPRPIVLLVHGGGWQSGAPDDLPELAQYLAARGYLVAAPAYRFAPEHRHPAAYEDLRAAIDLLRGRASTWNADGERLVLIGRSAGAHLALLTAYTAGLEAIRGVVSLYGPADLRFGWEHPGNPRVYEGTRAIEALLGGSPADVPALYDQASPYFLVGPRTPPTLLIHGRKDELVWVEQSRRLAQRLAEHGRPHLYVELPWATHGCDFAIAGPCGQITLYAVERFLAGVTAH